MTERLPCELPPLPQPIALGGVPQGETVVVTKDGLAELARYLVGMRAWIAAASGCIGAGP